MAIQVAKTSFEQGLEKGREQGIEQGEMIGRIHMCQEMLKLPLSPRDELERLSLEELTNRAEQLKQQFIPKTNGAS